MAGNVDAKPQTCERSNTTAYRWIFYGLLVLTILNNLTYFLYLLTAFGVLCALIQPLQDYVRKIIEANTTKILMYSIAFAFIVAFVWAFELFEAILPWILLFKKD